MLSIFSRWDDAAEKRSVVATSCPRGRSQVGTPPRRKRLPRREPGEAGTLGEPCRQKRELAQLIWKTVAFPQNFNRVM